MSDTDSPASVTAPAEQVAAEAPAAEAPAKPRRKRRTKAEMEAARAAEAAARAAAEAAGEPWPPKRRRGRPKKSEVAAKDPAPASSEAPALAEAVPAESPDQEAAPEKRRRRGRPRKSVEAVEAAAPAHEGAPDAPVRHAEALATEGQPGEGAEKVEKTADRAEKTGETEKAEKAEKTEKAEKAEKAEGADRPEQQDRAPRKHRRQGQQGGAPAQAPGQGQGKRQNGQGRRRNRRQDLVAEPSLSRDELAAMKVAELRTKASELGVEYVGVRKQALVDAVYAAAAAAEGFRSVEGILEIGNEGYGWVRTGNYMEGDEDAFVHQQLIRSLGLRPGDRVAGTVGPGRANSKYPPLQRVSAVNGRSPEGLKARPRFRDLTPVYPNERLVMECGKDSITGRAIDLVSPIGKGQRGLIVSPPKAGKTTVLKKICQSIAANNPEVHLFCLLVDERPEEVTDMERSIRGEVVASTFDMPADNHTHVSELVIEHAKRLVEMGEDVVVVLDSITRLARAYNLAQPASGRILSGGVDSAALYPPKKFLGAARNIENGGSLTIIASALVDTGSKMDEVIFEEFKGTGNMELKLDRDLADKRIFPAIDPVASGTRNEDLLIEPEYQPLVWGIRRVLANMNNVERAANALVRGLKETDSNREFLIKSAKKAAQTGYVG